MTDFSKMDPQEVCGWIAQRIDDNWYDNVDLYDPDIGRFHLPACAWAARNWCREHKLDSWVNTVCLLCGQVFYADNLYKSTPKDWLLAAAKVIEEKEKKC